MSDTIAHQILGRYQLLVAVARGGMGQVWLARLLGARGVNKVVAIKTLLPNESDRARLEAMLAEEARLASLIQHANVVHTIELGEHDGMLYLVMEWVEGEPLSYLQARAQQYGGMPIGVSVSLVAQVLAGLHAAHELHGDSGALGVVHRDVSPHNVLVTYDGVAKLLDFGIAKATHQPSGNTDTGEIKGKFSYMAPEQILGGAVDRRCDVFAAGIVLYSLTTGRHPFKHQNTAQIIRAITSPEPVPPPSTLVPGFPEELEQVLLKALEKDPENRWGSAEEFRDALELAFPDAFGDAGRTELRVFIEKAVGDRRLERREALRRAQQAADNAELGSVGRLQAAYPASASSLRALAISQQPAPEALANTRSNRGADGAPLTSKRAKAPWIAAAAGTVLTLAALLPPYFSRGGASTQAAAMGVASGVPLVASEPRPAIKTTLAATTATIPPTTSVAPTTSAAPTTTSVAPTTGVAPSRAAAGTQRNKGRNKDLPAARNSDASSVGDLLTPEYAR